MQALNRSQANKPLSARIRSYCKEHRPETIIICCALAVLGIALLRYLKDNPISALYQWVAVLVDLALYCLIGIVFVVKLGCSWRRPSPSAEARREGFRRYALIFLTLLAVHGVRILAAYALQALETGAFPAFRDALSVWKAPDSIHYMNIASHWYRGLEENGVVWRLVFLPFYPILIKAFSFITGEYFISGMIVSVLSSSLAGCVLYALARVDMDEASAHRAVKYFVLLPTAFFYTTAMTESLFILLSLLCIYGARRRKWLLAGAAGGLAAFTRSVGVILIAPVLLEWIGSLIAEHGKDRIRALLWGAAIMLIPLGFAGYLYINYAETGDPLTFMTYQKEHWFQQPGPFFGSVRYQLEYLIGYLKNGRYSMAMGLSIPNLVSQFAALGLVAATTRKQHASYLLYFLAYFAAAMGVTWLLSAPRYLLVLFPIVFSVAELTKKRQVDAAVTVLFAVLGALYFLAYFKQYAVY